MRSLRGGRGSGLGLTGEKSSEGSGLHPHLLESLNHCLNRGAKETKKLDWGVKDERLLFLLDF